ncbi:MAG: hypothetical protein JWM82_4540 [Myxococcales bacterium]|nr:hypothetical protein [Myxococcales bacterium]
MNERSRLRVFLFSSVLAAMAVSCRGGASRPGTGAAGQNGGAGSSAAGAPSATAGGSGAAGATAQGGAGTAQGGSGGSSVPDASAGGASGGGGGVVDAQGGSSGSVGAGGFVGTGCKGATVCYDFEECKTPTGWTVPNGEGNQGAGMTLVDKVMAHSGMCALHMKDFNGDSPQHAYLANLPTGFGPVLWGRGWVFNTSAPTNHGALVKARFSIANKADLDWYEVGYELKNYNGHWHSPLPPSGLPEWILRSSTPVATGRWQCVEWLWDAQNGDMPQAADPRLWVDGQEVMFGPGLQYNGDGNNTTPNRPTTPKGIDFVSIEVGLTMYHPVDEKMDVFLDELAFGKTRVGCNP